MGVIKKYNLSKTNSRSNRRCSDFEQLEKEFQEAQAHYEIHEDKESWDIMWMRINHAVFNSLNKKLSCVLSRNEIEERTTEITCNIIRSILNKKKMGMEWKIGKLSSAVHLPCLIVYSEKQQFQDEILDESYFTMTDEDGMECIREFEDSYMKDGIMIQKLTIKNDIEKEKNQGMDFNSAFSYMKIKHGIEEKDILDVISIIEDKGMDFEQFCTDRQKMIAQILVRLLEGDTDE